MGGSGGWLTANKTAAEIARDKARALEKRKQQRTTGRRASSSTKKKNNTKKKGASGSSRTKKAAAPRKQKRSFMDDDSSEEEEDDSDEDSFVVDDDEELSEEEAGSSSDEDEALLVETRKKPTAAMKRDRKQPARGPHKQSSSSSEDNDDDERGESGQRRSNPLSFAPTERKSKMAPHMRKATAAAATRKNSAASSKQPAKHKQQRNPFGDFTAPSSLKQEKENSKNGRVMAPPPALAAAAKAGGARAGTTDLDSDDSDLEDVFETFNKKPKQDESNNGKSRNAAAAVKRSRTVLLDDDDDDDSDDLSVGLLAQHNKKRRIAAMTDDDETPFKKAQKSDKKRVDKSSDGGVLGSINPLDYDGFSGDEDEAAAVAAALSESMQQEEHDRQLHKTGRLKKFKPKKKKTKRTKVVVDIEDSDDDDNHDEKDKKQEPEYIEFEDESSSNDENDNDNDERDDYGGDKDAQTAANVLAMANDLSRQVLRTMQSWAGGGGGGTTEESDNNAKEPAAPVGMIVDGALALGDLSAAASQKSGQNDQQHDWISQETMKLVCPNVKLADYQLIGVNWMALLNGMQVNVQGKATTSKKMTKVNGVLADEMGLGKTCQTITFLAWLKYQREHAQDQDDNGLGQDDQEADDDKSESKKPGVAKGYVHPHLIVVPSSVLSNWMLEFEKFAPNLNVVKFHGTIAQRRELKEDLRLHLPRNAVSRKRAGLEPIDVIVAPITYFQKEKSEDRSFLRKFQFNYLVVDEAHLLKNASGLRYRTLDQFDTQNRLLLTGTPVQNSPQELMALLCFLMPLFSTKTHRHADDDDAENGHDGGENMLHHFVSLETTASGGTGNGAVVDDATAYKKLKQLFAPFVLRRRKQDVLSQIMPPKERKVEFVQLDNTSRAIYDGILSDHVQAKRAGKVRSATNTEHVFTQLRKAAHHPLLLRTRHSSPSEQEKLAKLFLQYGAFRGEGCTLAKVREQVEKMNDFDIHLTALELISENERRRDALSAYILDQEDLFASPKFVRLRQLLPELVAGGHRILIFSIWTSCLDLLTCLLEHMDLRYLRMQGSTPVSERQDLIDAFTEDASIPIFLLSTKACGLGINLTAADTCIMHDIDFNPFNDLQAEDRVHRIGQTKTTSVIKMVTADTVDADIYEMQNRKARMNAAIMDANNKHDNNDVQKQAAASPSNDDSCWKGEAAKAARNEVLKTAMDRFLTTTSAVAKGTDSSEHSTAPFPDGSEIAEDGTKDDK